MTEPNNYTEENFDAEVDVNLATAATEEFNYTIGDAVAPVVEEGSEETVEPVSLHEGPIQTVGRRKRAIARVTVTEGDGTITVNGREFENYFPNKLHQQDILQPLTLLDRESQFNIKANISGGGPTGQAGALRLAIARALNVYNPAERPTLKKAGLLTRDARAVERKKAGLHKARRAPQYSKR
ncbi:30S ribosomal protein S9 [Corynebacterium sanguinis]|uniref:Small ribosomal subunit protein uS9 n=1 Tax=Corynebacterium sanguinis TaxID=2594913 RepID=A0A6C1TZN5_9CORY|nr:MULTISPECIES: 30S ribosomal protein S9 [Corynebacterium]MCT1627511.1 30S ribosomal protein S9 [Corynebacterium sanguinis]MCT1695411.1 30S ribosomal protein S9 [Corynebacterium sanguinis]MCT1714739.1 30S ribosomal protein S9 [Corynebacterium sanguinis]TVS23980.1 30S ribosomal protein S9 [Corynebacterium sanguinis]TVS30254.1 30S ribosomal protein S9 [Corynebacterium sanguinis]